MVFTSENRVRLMHIIARVTVGFVWIYHGIVPKLVFQHADELAILHQAGVDEASAPAMVNWIGAAEVVIGLWVLIGFPSPRWPFLMTIVFGVGTTIGVMIQSPAFLIAAFNPMSLNVMLIALSCIGLLSMPTADRPDQPAGA